MLEREISYYEKNKKKFREMYAGKYIVIRDREVIGVYDTHMEAYDSAVAEYEVGTFMIKHIVKR